MVKFDTGRLLMTRTVNDTVADSEQFAKEVTTALRKYVMEDWGDLSKGDKKLNDEAVKSGADRILASYKTSEGKVYVITEHDRSYTTVMFADEY